MISQSIAPLKFYDKTFESSLKICKSRFNLITLPVLDQSPKMDLKFGKRIDATSVDLVMIVSLTG